MVLNKKYLRRLTMIWDLDFNWELQRELVDEISTDVQQWVMSTPEVLNEVIPVLQEGWSPKWIIEDLAEELGNDWFLGSNLVDWSLVELGIREELPLLTRVAR
jgi:hypothetical protein